MRNASAKEIWRRAKEVCKVWYPSVENKAAAEPLDWGLEQGCILRCCKIPGMGAGVTFTIRYLVLFTVWFACHRIAQSLAAPSSCYCDDCDERRVLVCVLYTYVASILFL